jgi:hypothetical protein
MQSLANCCDDATIYRLKVAAEVPAVKGSFRTRDAIALCTAPPIAASGTDTFASTL